MSFIIKPVTENDATEFAETHTQSWKAAYKGIVPDEYLNSLSIEARAEKLKKNIVQFVDFEYLAGWLDHKIIGTLVIGPCRDDDIDADEIDKTGEVCGIYLHPDYFGKGYGYQLMNHAISSLKRKYSKITLWVLEDNARARRFYEKAGFVFDGTRKEIVIGKPLIEIRYCLTLTNQ